MYGDNEKFGITWSDLDKQSEDFPVGIEYAIQERERIKSVTQSNGWPDAKWNKKYFEN